MRAGATGGAPSNTPHGCRLECGAAGVVVSHFYICGTVRGPGEANPKLIVDPDAVCLATASHSGIDDGALVPGEVVATGSPSGLGGGNLDDLSFDGYVCRTL